MILQLKDYADEDIKALDGFIKDIEILRLSADSLSDIENCESLSELTNVLPFNRVKNILSYLYNNAEIFQLLRNDNSDNSTLSLSNNHWLEFGDNIYFLRNGDQVDIIEKIESPTGDFYFGFYYSINLSDYNRTTYSSQIKEWILEQEEKGKPITEDTAFVLAISDTLLPEDAISVITNDKEEVVDDWIMQWKLLYRDYAINK